MATGLSVAWSVLAVREPLEGRRRKGATKPRPTGGEAERRLAMQGRMRDGLVVDVEILETPPFRTTDLGMVFIPHQRN
jgi:hypothetical protein